MARKKTTPKKTARKTLLGRVQEFTTTVKDKLDTISFKERQRLARSVLEEVVLDEGHVRLLQDSDAKAARRSARRRQHTEAKEGGGPRNSVCVRTVTRAWTCG